MSGTVAQKRGQRTARRKERVHKGIVLFPKGLPSPKKGRYAAFLGDELVGQGNNVARLEAKVRRDRRHTPIIIDVGFDYKRTCFF